MTTETLMTEAATTTEGQASEQATGSATVAGEGGQTQQTTEGQQAAGGQQQQAEGQQGTEGEQGTKQPQGAPEKYEFQPVEGAAIDQQVLDQFAEVAKELNLPQDQAQKLIDKVAPVIQARQVEQIAAVQAQWAEESRADKEFGGDNLEANIGTAKKALDTFGTPELRSLLHESGMGNHPEVIRFLVRTGKAISEDRLVVGSAPGQHQAGDAKRFYPNSNMN